MIDHIFLYLSLIGIGWCFGLITVSYVEYRHKQRTRINLVSDSPDWWNQMDISKPIIEQLRRKPWLKNAR